MSIIGQQIAEGFTAFEGSVWRATQAFERLSYIAASGSLPVKVGFFWCLDEDAPGVRHWLRQSMHPRKPKRMPKRVNGRLRSKAARGKR